MSKAKVLIVEDDGIEAAEQTLIFRLELKRANQ